MYALAYKVLQKYRNLSTVGTEKNNPVDTIGIDRCWFILAFITNKILIYLL